MVAQAAIAALPLIEPVARGALQLAQTPVLGWERVESYTRGRKRPHAIVQRTSFTLRAWELAAAGGVGFLIVWGLLVQKAQKEGTVPALPGNLQTIFDFFF
jgi:hypothetical protein